MERAILIGVSLPGTRRADIEASLEELSRLAETAGARAEETFVQARRAIDPAYYIGEGKARELREIVAARDIHTVIFDEDLRPVQQKNLEEAVGAKIIDRTRLILDIFAKRARSKEGILQVERAQLAYYLPRLSKRGTTLDSQVGGIGTRGPGERKLEVDQRRIRDRITQLDREIEAIRRHRQLTRKKRTAAGMPVVAIVGYTNAGKSTLLNTLSGGGEVYADDKLFATLDPTTRQVLLPGGRTVLFTDTVGFINKLPHTLVAAFRATLEEITGANCLLHVIDISDPEHGKQTRSVLKVLEEIEAGGIPTINVYNKKDLLPEKERRKLEREGALLISAATGEGIHDLLERVAGVISPRLQAHRVTVPYGDDRHLAAIHRLSVVRKQSYGDRGTVLSINSTPENWDKIRAMLRPKEPAAKGGKQ